MPSGPVEEITGVVFTANGQTLAWRRDDVDLYQFHLTIPPGVTTLHAHLDCISDRARYAEACGIGVGKLMLYPANTPVRDIPIQPSVKVPAGWGIGTALTPVSSGSYPVPAAGADDAVCGDDGGAASGLAGNYWRIFPRVSAGARDHAQALHRCGLGFAGGLEPAPGGAGID